MKKAVTFRAMHNREIAPLRFGQQVKVGLVQFIGMNDDAALTNQVGRKQISEGRRRSAVMHSASHLSEKIEQLSSAEGKHFIFCPRLRDMSGQRHLQALRTLVAETIEFGRGGVGSMRA